MPRRMFLRAHERLGYEQVGRGDRLPGGGEVLADPCLAEAEVVGEFEDVEVPLVSVPCGALGRVRGHEEQTGFHGGDSFRWCASLAGFYLMGDRACGAIIAGGRGRVQAGLGDFRCAGGETALRLWR